MSIIEQAKIELHAANWSPRGTAVMVEILEKFFDEWDSGGAVACAALVLMRLIAGKPLTPLTGDDDEWNDISEMSGQTMFQNRRCSSVFKDAERAYSIDTPGRPTIIFPYWPDRAVVDPPVVEIG